MFLIIIIGLITFIIYRIYKIYNYYHHWQRQGIPADPYPSFGWFKQPFHEFMVEQAKRFGKIYGAYGFNQQVIIINDAKMAHDISIKELHKFPKRMLGHFGSGSLPHSLFFIPVNEDWKRIRSIVTPSFTSGKLKGMLTPINRIVENFLKQMEHFSETGEKFDVKNYTSAFTMDVIASCAYGIDVDSMNQPNHPLVTHARRILSIDVTFQQIICFMLPSVAKFLGLEPFDIESSRYFDDLTFKIIEKRLEMDKNNNNKKEQHKDLIGLIMEQMDDNNKLSDEIPKSKGITRKEIAGQGIIFFLAGHDTTNLTFCHAIYNLIKNPEWQDKLYDELIDAQQSSKVMDYEFLRSLPILNAVINETLRLYPPLVVIQRSTDKQQTLLDTGIIIPAHTSISFHVYTMQRDAEYFPEPNEFRPERFLGKENSAENNPAFIPFGMGPRICVGMRFALSELRTVLSSLILNYHLVPDPDLKLDYFNGNILLSPKKVMIQVRKRV